ncbi:hypothetical protein ACV229_31855 [Burkholderia sp. MR1-5-21]
MEQLVVASGGGTGIGLATAKYFAAQRAQGGVISRPTYCDRSITQAGRDSA